MNDNKKFTYLLLHVTPLALIIFSSLPRKLSTAARIVLRRIFSHFRSESYNASTFEWEDAQAFFKMDQILKSMVLKS